MIRIPAMCRTLWTRWLVGCLTYGEPVENLMTTATVHRAQVIQFVGLQATLHCLNGLTAPVPLFACLCIAVAV